MTKRPSRVQSGFRVKVEATHQAIEAGLAGGGAECRVKSQKREGLETAAALCQRLQEVVPSAGEEAGAQGAEWVLSVSMSPAMLLGSWAFTGVCPGRAQCLL